MKATVELYPLNWVPSNFSSLRGSEISIVIRLWVKNKPPGIGPQILVHVSIYEGSILGTDF